MDAIEEANARGDNAKAHMHAMTAIGKTYAMMFGSRKPGL